MTADDVDPLHSRLREARERVGLSQSQVAKHLGLHRPTVSEIEGGRRKVSAQELSRFAELYRVTTTWLLGEQSNTELNLHVAARELARLKPADLDALIEILKSLASSKEDDNN